MTRQQLQGISAMLLVFGMAFVDLSGIGEAWAAERPGQAASLQAAQVDVFFAGGQSNAGREWRQAIEETSIENQTGVAQESREIHLTWKLLLIPIAKGQSSVDRKNDHIKLSVRVDGKLVHDLALHLAQTKDAVEWWSALDMSKHPIGRR